jgi:hypothetical protein
MGRGGGDAGGAVGFQKSITVPALGGADLDDFPLYLELDDADLMARAAADGSDIHFIGPGGEALDHEVQRWDPGSGHLRPASSPTRSAIAPARRAAA